MSSDHTIRQMIIDENLPLLVKKLTGFKENDENFTLCESYAFNRIASHRFLSVNSHEVRRRIDGIAERFMADNYTQYGEKLKELAQEFVNDPLCTNHYEYDIQWSLLHFLMGVSKNPVAALSEDKNSIRIDDSGHGDDIHPDRRKSTALNDLVTSLIKSNIPAVTFNRSKDTGNESDLSDWSDDEAEGGADVSVKSQNTSHDSRRSSALRLKLIPYAKEALRPPEKRLIITDFDVSKAMTWREEYIQRAWWLEKTPQNGVSILPEWCLLREIIWTLQMAPIDTEIETESLKKFSKFFSLKTATDEFMVNPNVTLTTTSSEGLKTVLSGFASISTKLYRFRKFFKTVFEPPAVNSFLDSVQRAPYSIQNYATGIKDFLRIVNHKLCELEIEIVKQDSSEVHTIIYLHNQMYFHFTKVKMLYDIHQRVYIDFKTNEGHVCTAYLFAGLINEIETSATNEHLNTAASLLLVSIRYYLHIFNRWWIEGQFKDWCSEFLIERCNPNRTLQSSNIYQSRSISGGISRSLNAAAIEGKIDKCKIVSLFRSEALEAGYILNILYNLDKLSEMKGQQSRTESQDIEDAFMDTFWDEINKFRIVDSDESIISEASENSEVNQTVIFVPESNSLLPNLVGEMDALLSMGFEQFASTTKNESDDDSDEEDEIFEDDTDPSNCNNVYEKLQKVTDFPMPLGIVIHQCLKKIFKSRIAVANKYVLRIFLDEYKVLDHLINLQRVFFFGAGDLMLTFYSKLFKNMNGCEDWNNSYHLSVQLDDVLTTRYPELHSMFSVSLSATDTHIKATLDAITDIIINYSVPDSVRDVIHDRALTKYNEIFRFLLQIKWAIWTLETLRFPIAFKKRSPYLPFTLIDLIFKRLALVRNWIIYSVQCIHSHLMSFVIQSMGQQLIERMAKVDCLREIIELHDSYIDTIYQHCFRKTSDAGLRTGIEQLLNLVVVLRDEWNNLEKTNSLGDFVDGENRFDVNGTVQQVDIIEATYINCHCHIAQVLTREVYTKNQTTLASLSAAFNCSCPY